MLVIPSAMGRTHRGTAEEIRNPRDKNLYFEDRALPWRQPLFSIGTTTSWLHKKSLTMNLNDLKNKCGLLILDPCDKSKMIIDGSTI